MKQLAKLKKSLFSGFSWQQYETGPEADLSHLVLHHPSLFPLVPVLPVTPPSPIPHIPPQFSVLTPLESFQAAFLPTPPPPRAKL